MSPATSARFHCGIVTTRFPETCEFYFQHFGFKPSEIAADYALLLREDGARLAVLQAGGEGQPAALRQPTRGAGVWLCLQADDVDTVHARLARHGVEIVAEPEYTLSGERRCVVRDPNGVLIYIVCRALGARGEGDTFESSHQPHTETHAYESHSYRIHRIPSH